MAHGTPAGECLQASEAVNMLRGVMGIFEVWAARVKACPTASGYLRGGGGLHPVTSSLL